ncbi:MAG: carboxylating nicotinate-nucleotide diphosphorylase [Oscillospiraceae bacterium]|nr:carboxylating nicotinate-nucleotide diphosphorylase [Oscillospiraceae bacterium]
MEPRAVDEIILNALREDIGPGDITTALCVPAGKKITGRFGAKQPGLICGLHVAARVFTLLGGNAEMSLSVEEGAAVERGDVVAAVSGEAGIVLKGERVALNLLQRMSGIATSTAEAVRAVAGFKTRITDTRKTTPGLRVLEKYAVRVGGGVNHRFGLYDGILIKDNHIAAAGGVINAVEAARRAAPHTLKIEVETSDLDEVRQAIEARADIIMLDNMDDMREAVALIGGRALTEASGDMGNRDLAEVAAMGVDLISIGALTHTVRALDISLKFDIC